MPPATDIVNDRIDGTLLSVSIDSHTLGFSPTHIWNPSPSSTHHTAPYPVPQTIRIGVQNTETSGAKFSPPPFAVILENTTRRAAIVVHADAGWHRWNFVAFHAGLKQINIDIDFEGHTDPACAREHVHVHAVAARGDESRLALLTRALQQLYPNTRTPSPSHNPDWWTRPIYCGWGDQVGLSMHLEGPDGPQGESRALAYCTQGLYTRWIDRLDAADVPFGTVTIDNGWSDAAVWTAYPNHWPDLRGFIDAQHQKGRKVLLWIPTWLCEGLPDAWCVHLDGQRLTADPTHPKYRAFLRDQVRRALSCAPDGYNADGFKIDQLAYVPCESQPRGGEQFGRTVAPTGPHAPMTLHSTTWGCELLHQLQRDIYDAAKNTKTDCLITSSTVHPYFADTFDMVRLHDTESTRTNVFDAMRSRADLARATLPGFPIDADDWVHCDYAQWLDYTARSPQIGVPCIFYAQWFVKHWHQSPAAIEIPIDDLRTIGQAWKRQLA